MRDEARRTDALVAEADDAATFVRLPVPEGAPRGEARRVLFLLPDFANRGVEAREAGLFLGRADEGAGAEVNRSARVFHTMAAGHTHRERFEPSYVLPASAQVPRPNHPQPTKLRQRPEMIYQPPPPNHHRQRDFGCTDDVSAGPCC